jgi:hypothetical protein
MNAKVLLLIAASVALAGCPDKAADKPAAPAPKVAAAPPPAPAPAPAPTPSTAAAPAAKAAAIACTGACSVDVPVIRTANGCSVDMDRNHRIDVTANPQVTVIKWQIQGDAAFKFDSPNGIAFDKGGAPPANVMQNGAGGGRTVTINDKHTGPASKGRWDYTIFVTDGTAKCKLDPSVDNN